MSAYVVRKLSDCRDRCDHAYPDDQRQEANVEGYADREAAEAGQPGQHRPLVLLGVDYPLQAPLHMEEHPGSKDAARGRVQGWQAHQQQDKHHRAHAEEGEAGEGCQGQLGSI